MKIDADKWCSPHLFSFLGLHNRCEQWGGKEKQVRGCGRKGKGQGCEAQGVVETPFPGLTWPPKKWWHGARHPPLQLLQMSSASPQRRRRRKKPQEPREEGRCEGRGASQQPSPSRDRCLCPLNSLSFSQVTIRLNIFPHHFLGALLSTTASFRSWAWMPVPSPSHLVYPPISAT